MKNIWGLFQTEVVFLAGLFSEELGLGSAFSVIYLVAQSQRLSHLSSLGDKNGVRGWQGEKRKPGEQ